jgi:TRAP-type C4-dicarboxylate transport system permease small subunit
MVQRALEILSTICAWIAGGAIFCIAMLGGLDVLSTIILDRPVDSTVEGTEALMVFSAFLAMGLVHQRRAYISVDLFYLMFPAAGRKALDVMALVLAAIYFGLIAWRGWISAFDSLAVREFSNGIVAIPMYPSKFALAIGMTVGTAWCVLDLLKGGRFRDAPPRPEKGNERHDAPRR